MRKTMIGLALAASTLAAMPASAQRYDDNYRGDRYDQRGDRYDQRGDERGYGYAYGRDTLRRAQMMLDRAIQRRELSQREVYYYRTELNRLYELDARYRRDGYNRWEREQIEDRAQRLIERLRDERREDRWDGRRDDRRWDR